MSRQARNSTVALPRLSGQDASSKSFVLQDTNDQQRGVFSPSALRDHQAPMSISSNRAFAAVLFGLFIVMLLISFLVGINVYQALNTMASGESIERLEQSFLANTIHSNDMYDAVLIGEGPEGAALVLRESIDGAEGYETRIYAFNGSIMQEYALEESPYAPEKAITLFDSDLFDFSYENGLLTITTDNGSVDVALRSAEGGRS